MTTHYVPRYCERVGAAIKAACGVWVHRYEHSCEPKCEKCLAYLTSEPEPDGVPR